jgi:cell division septal protein FtsQ
VTGVVAAVDEGEPPPAELKLAWQCERYNALPDSGGVLDQDAGLITRMGAAVNIYNTLQKYRRAVGKEIHKLTDGDRSIIKLLLDRGLI